jgi:hypothetical protein
MIQICLKRQTSSTSGFPNEFRNTLARYLLNAFFANFHAERFTP